MNTLTDMWEMVVTRVLPGIITASILAGVGLLWTQQADLSAIRTDIAVIKERTIQDTTAIRERLVGHDRLLDELRARVRAVEKEVPR